MENMTRTRGDTIELVCEFSGDGEVKTKWLHLGQQWSVRRTNGEKRISDFNSSSQNAIGSSISDGSTNNEDSRITVRETDGVVTLTVSAIDEDDAGQYQCVAENEAGFDQDSIFLSIILIRKFHITSRSLENSYGHE
ncbi:unnamed protein product [Gongylonema pulchrum]|uniref:Ig-like domain-containing protein n=1 Tax=Gongylonema pulchrum TaxID=637853 RepID=A0A183DGY4_9BILA|nr:unnamed protein product [Gongylonema pulchrum]